MDGCFSAILTHVLYNGLPQPEIFLGEAQQLSTNKALREGKCYKAVFIRSSLENNCCILDLKGDEIPVWIYRFLQGKYDREIRI